MALLWVDGFESYGTSNGSAPSPTGILTRQYTVGTESSMDIEEGRLGSGHSLESYGTNYIKTPVLTTNDTVVVGFAFQPRYISTDVMYLYDGSTEGMGLFFSYGKLQVYRGSTLLKVADFEFSLNNWYWIEFKVKCNDTIGTYELRVGETDVASDTGVDTKAGSNNYHDNVRLTTSTAATNRYDDFYICDGAGAVNNDFLGNVSVTTLFPSGAGFTTDFTPSAGANYENVDEQLIDEDSTYNESSTSGHKDTYAYGNVGAGLSNIKGLQINTLCRETDVTSYSLVTPIRSNATDYDDSAQLIGTTDYVFKRRVAELDPNTSAAWLEAAVNAAEFGIKVG